MPLPSRCGSLIAALALAVSPALASAQGTASERLPRALRLRPITLPGGALTLHGSLSLHRIGAPSPALATGLMLGASWGLRDDVELTITALAVSLSPRIAWGLHDPNGRTEDLGAAMRWRFLRGAAQMAFALGATVRAVDEVVFGVDLGVLGQLVVPTGRLDASLHARVESGAPVRATFTVPIRYAHQWTPSFALWLSTGLTLRDGGDDLRLPAGIGAQFTTATVRGAPAVDVSVAVDFDRLVDLRAGAVHTETYVVTGAARFYVR